MMSSAWIFFIAPSLCVVIGAIVYLFILRVRLKQSAVALEAAQAENRLNQALLKERDMRLQEYGLLSNLQADLNDFRDRIEGCYGEERREVFALKQTVESLAKVHQDMNDSARKLADSLRGSSKMRGGWGELVLERVLEASGLVKDRDYLREGIGQRFKDNEGVRRRPDVIVYLPEGKHLVIDSKLSLISYERLCACESLGEPDLPLVEDFFAAIRAQVAALSSKDYVSLNGLVSPDFVFMFIPIEGAFAYIMDRAPDIYTWAAQKGVLLCSPSSLVSALKIVNMLWKDEKSSQNALEIAKRAGKLFDKFALCLEDLQEIGKALESSLRLHSSVMQRWTSGRGSVAWQVEELRQLGAHTKKEIQLPLHKETSKQGQMQT